MSIAVSLGHTFSKSMATTPGSMVLHLVLTCIAAVLLLLAALFGVHEQQQALRMVCQDSAPSILAAQHIKAALADMDAEAAHGLLTPAGEDGAALVAFAAQRKDWGESLVAAAENITYGDDERKPIQNMVNDMASYEAAVTRARLLHQQKNGEYMAAYLEATALLQDNLLTQADALDQAKADALDETYGRQQKLVTAGLALVVLHGLILLALLLRTQFFVSQKTRRTFNGGMLVATVLAVAFLGWTFRSLKHSAADLRIAKQDAFDNLNALWQTRAAAYDARGAEMRWLLAEVTGTASAAEGFQRQYFNAADKIASMPAGESLADAAKAVHASNGTLPTGFNGYLADELSNVTFPGERASATATLESFIDFRDLDQKVRNLEQSGAHQAAVALCTGTESGQETWAFDQFDEALGKTIDLKQTQFNAAYQRGRGALAGYNAMAVVVTALICLSCILGLWPRLKEYAI